MAEREIRSLGVEAPGRPYIWSYREGDPGEGQFRVETLYTGLSAGTELTFLKGTNPYLAARWDEPYAVFVPGEPGLAYPVPFLGYMEVGRVVETRSPAVRDGDVVAMTYGHKTGHTADAGSEFFLPLGDLDPILGIYVAQMGPIAANGLLHAAADLYGADVRDLGDGVRGRNVVVMGAGVVGLLTALLCRRFGAGAVLVADPDPWRRQKVAALGLEAIPEAGAWQTVKDLWSDGRARGADVVFQCRANGGSLQQALKLLRPQGTVIDLAFYQGGAEAVRLGEEFHHNGLALRCAQIGRVPRGLDATWNRRRLARETLAFLRAEAEPIRTGLITDIVPFDAAPDFLADLVRHRRAFVQVVFQVSP
ncbi:zinc-dependent alcohol dehydrogenase [Prosthecomicrobium sp. N25]|uniref:zinc-dependent alcohol dehydrogenase n=1 Tax=Prosthecomicrobium sp. N25 TaxID=3129254 RepID=UPI0030783D57